MFSAIFMMIVHSSNSVLHCTVNGGTESPQTNIIVGNNDMRKVKESQRPNVDLDD